MTHNQQNISIKNKKAFFDYEILETFFAGIQLTGTEIKSIRGSKASLVDSYGAFWADELYVKNMHIAEYELGTCKAGLPLFRLNSSSTTGDWPNSKLHSPKERKPTTNAKP
jgi:hypothetical protein